jgi:hypothetical protein
LFDDTYAMIGINDFVADVKIQVRSTHKKAPGKVKGSSGEKRSSLLQIDYSEMGGKARTGAGLAPPDSQGWVNYSGDLM